MTKFILILISLFLTSCAINEPNINNMDKGVVKFYIMKGFYIKETPGDWQYKNNAFETPFISQTMDRNLTVYGTITYREDWEKPRAKVQMITNNEKSILGKWIVYNCDTKTVDLNGSEKQQADFNGDDFSFKKGFIIDENCGMINLNK